MGIMEFRTPLPSGYLPEQADAVDADVTFLIGLDILVKEKILVDHLCNVHICK